VAAGSLHTGRLAERILGEERAAAQRLRELSCEAMDATLESQGASA